MEHFKKWLTDNTTLSKKSISNYVNAMETIRLNLVWENMLNLSLDEIKQVEQLEQLKIEYFSIKKYKDRDIRGRNMYNAAFNRYIHYIKNK
tara:strand:+ start:623 stop:895 length:273 start_codon:yes stop_codon:yes gene_type:complete